MNVLREVADMIANDGNNQLFVGSVGSVSSAGVMLYRPGSIVLEGPYFTLSPVGAGDRVLVARVGKGYVVIGTQQYFQPFTLVSSSPYTVLDSDYIIVVDSASAVTINLPTVVGRHRRVYHIKRIGAGVVTIDPNSTETIDGATTKNIANQYESYQIVAEDGTITFSGQNRWHII